MDELRDELTDLLCKAVGFPFMLIGVVVPFWTLLIEHYQHGGDSRILWWFAFAGVGAAMLLFAYARDLFYEVCVWLLTKLTKRRNLHRST